MSVAVDSYLIETRNASECFKLLSKEFQSKEGLVVSRFQDSEVSKTFKNKKIKSLWLTDIQTDIEHISPKQVEQLLFSMEQYVNQKKQSFVIFTGLEYIISYTSYVEVLHLVQHIKDVANQNDVIFVVNVGKGTLESKELNLLRQELVIYDVQN